jgi:hypothetical protein
MTVTETVIMITVTVITVIMSLSLSTTFSVVPHLRLAGGCAIAEVAGA